ncbi:LOB domain-containing protein 24-like [Telopea speciosissima]|uniref:LOB domain-containing protein 24-like n=1 Tax=Telopea speciosissima TaxID=54955 RepID=UPI001CC3954A|nr:LOB domain-containing protein 24-like [Telopea speciosissima]
MSHSTRCAACKSLRRRCPRDCILAPYFPSNDPQRFSSVHKIFGASNISKILQQLPVQERAKAADCMSFEATSRIQDPVYGCVRIISQLQQQLLITQRELVMTQAQLAFYYAQQQ